MSTRQMPPAGWYQEPKIGVGLRYWDGAEWTDHVSVSGQQYVSPYSNLDASKITTGHISADKIKEQKPAWLEAEEVDEEALYRTRGTRKIYWDNLFRFRTWWFSLSTGILALFLLSFLGIPGIFYTPVLLIVSALTFCFWMTRQMACRQCGTLLRVTRLSGSQDVCHKCGAPTD